MSTDGIDYRIVLADLYARRDKIDAAIAGIKAILGEESDEIAPAQSAVAPDSAPPSRISLPVTIQSDTFFGLPVLEAAIKFLRISKRKQSTQDIATALEQGGFTHRAGNFLSTVNSALWREAQKDDGRLVKVGRGEWGLPEWYPGMKRSKVANG